jgi:hypothetical protein
VATLFVLSAALPALLSWSSATMHEPTTDRLAASRPVIAAMLLGELRLPPAAAPEPAHKAARAKSAHEAAGGTRAADQTKLDGLTEAISARPGGRPPHTATSLYMKTTEPRRANRLGCKEGFNLRGTKGNSALVLLAFGRPRQRGGHPGVSLFGEGFRSPRAVREAAQAYAAGYVRCVGKEPARLHIAIGTSNYGPKVTFAHGAAWGRMVNDANAWAKARGDDGRVEFAGANDIELAWNGPAVTRAWVRGYQSVAEWPFYDYGDAGGCPPAGPACHGGWTLEDLWYVSWGARLALPLPEVYTPSGSQARQWANLSLFSYRRHGSRMHFVGVLSQHTACAQSADSCWGMNNRPERAWRQLHDLLNGDQRTAQPLAWSSDISWTRP